MADLLEGADAEGYEDFCEEVYNVLKNNWRQSDPCTNVSEKQPGMILSDEDDEKLYHVGLDSYVCDEILQERRSFDAIPIFQSVDLGIRQIMTTTRARAYLSAQQDNIANTTWTKILLDAESYDSGSNFDVTNNRFAVPVSGYYLVAGAATWVNIVTDQRYVIGLYLGGALHSSVSIHASFSGRLTSFVSDVLYATAAQNIELYVYHTAGVGTVDVVGAAQETFLTVHLLSI